MTAVGTHPDPRVAVMIDAIGVPHNESTYKESERMLAALDAHTKRSQKRCATAMSYAPAQPGVTDECMYVAFDDGTLWCLESGVKWTQVPLPPVVQEGGPGDGTATGG